MTSHQLPTKYMSTYQGKAVEVYEWPDGLEVKDPHTKQNIRYEASDVEQIIENMER